VKRISHLVPEQTHRQRNDEDQASGRLAGHMNLALLQREVYFLKSSSLEMGAVGKGLRLVAPL